MTDGLDVSSGADPRIASVLQAFDEYLEVALDNDTIQLPAYAEYNIDFRISRRDKQIWVNKIDDKKDVNLPEGFIAGVKEIVKKYGYSFTSYVGE